MGPIDGHETSIKNYHYSLCNSPQECSSHLICSRSLKSRKKKNVAFQLLCCVLQEIQVAEPPQLITLVDSSLSGSSGGGIADNHICVGYRHQFDLVNERTGEVSRLHAVEGSRAHLVAAIDLYEDEEPELLLCYNRKSLKSSWSINQIVF